MLAVVSCGVMHPFGPLCNRDGGDDMECTGLRVFQIRLHTLQKED